MPKKKNKWETLDEEEYYKIGISRGVVKVSEEKNKKIRTVSFSREFKSGDSWIPKRGKFFSISFRSIGKIIEILIKFARKFGWEVPPLEKPENQIKELKKQLDEVTRQRMGFEEAIKNLESQIESYRVKIKDLRRKILEKNTKTFKQDLEKFEKLIDESEKGGIREEDIQIFIKERPWIISPEYHDIKPKKPAGSKSKFDFYLEDYKGQGTIVELELPSDPIFSRKEKYGLSAKCGESLGQLIRYLETTIMISHSKEMSRIEKIDEIKPLGFLIIGRTKTQEENDKLKIVNAYLHFIQILSYDMLLLRAKKFLEPWPK